MPSSKVKLFLVRTFFSICSSSLVSVIHLLMFLIQAGRYAICYHYGLITGWKRAFSVVFRYNNEEKNCFRRSVNVKVLCWRQRYQNGRIDNGHSLLLNVKYTKTNENLDGPMQFYGWEKNEKGQLTPRFVDLSASMDTQKYLTRSISMLIMRNWQIIRETSRIAESAVSLNLQLMRWRLVPELNLNQISETSCLLFGAGTLGCNIARCLLVQVCIFFETKNCASSSTFSFCISGLGS